MQEKYLNAGFLHVELGEPEVTALEEGLLVRVSIVEGDQFSIGKVDVAGDETVDLEALREQLKLKEGETFNRSYLTDDVEELELYYTNRGFYFASVNPRTLIEGEELRVDVTFEVEKGPLYFIREIDVVGNSITVDPVIRREMRLVEGQLYSARAIRISQNRIRSLGFFEEVNFEPQQTDYPDQLDLGVKVVERPTGSLSFGAGFSSQDSFVISGSLSQTQPVRAGLRGYDFPRYRRGERSILPLLRRSLFPGVHLQPLVDPLRHRRDVRVLPAAADRCRVRPGSLPGRGAPSARLRALQLRESLDQSGYRRQRGLGDLPGASSGR